MANIIDNVECAAFKALVDRYYDSLADENERTHALLKMAEVMPRFYSEFTPEKVENLKTQINDPDSRLMKLLGGIIGDADSGYAKKMIMTLGYEAGLKGTKTIRKNREKYGCNIPWLILFDPTMACNMHCIGCWSGTYGHKSSLTFEEMDRIVTQGKELGVHFYMMTGGEPMVKKNEILALCEKHSDCFFAAFTNSTLITEDLCKKVKKIMELL